jgi:hypothetical protein
MRHRRWFLETLQDGSSVRKELLSNIDTLDEPSSTCLNGTWTTCISTEAGGVSRTAIFGAVEQRCFDVPDPGNRLEAFFRDALAPEKQLRLRDDRRNKVHEVNRGLR